MPIGSRLKEARDALGLAQTAFAERCGVSKNTQYLFEKDEHLPGAAYLLKLAELGVDVNYVLLGRPSATTPEEAVLLNAFRAADEKTRKTLLAHALIGQSAVSDARTVTTVENARNVVRGKVKAQQFVQEQNISGDQNNDFSTKR